MQILDPEPDMSSRAGMQGSLAYMLTGEVDTWGMRGSQQLSVRSQEPVASRPRSGSHSTQRTPAMCCPTVASCRAKKSYLHTCFMHLCCTSTITQGPWKDTRLTRLTVYSLASRCCWAGILRNARVQDS